MALSSSTLPARPVAAGAWDARYERRAVAILATGFGLVGLDRFIILPLLPAMMKDLHLDYQAVGLLTSAFSIAWGAAALLTGGVSDRIGRRRTLIPAIVVFSLLAGLSGLAVGLVSLIAIRVLMGLAEGAFTPCSIAATIEASKPSRRGFNLGLQQNFATSLGLGIGPILATQLLLVLPSWRWVFLIVSAPGLVLAAFALRVLRDTQGSLEPTLEAGADPAERRWTDVFAHRNVPLAAFGMCCMLTSLLVATTLAPNYLVDHLHFDTRSMGWVLSGVGFGSFVGQFVLPGLSDRVGRKPVVLACYVGAFVTLSLFLRAGPAPWLLFALLFVFSFCNNSMICLNVGPVTGEAVPAALTATATGVVVGLGEILGGGVSPTVAGYVATHAGLGPAFFLALGGLGLGFVAALFLRETAPARVVARR